LSCSYQIDVDRKLIEVKFSGLVSIDEKIECDRQIIDDPRYQPGMSAVWDITAATFNWNLADIDRLRVYVRGIRDRVGRSFWAVVVGESPADFTAKLFSLLHEAYDTIIIIQLFKSQTDALAWLESQTQPEHGLSGPDSDGKSQKFAE
jgi:hypothetical protein